MDLINISLPALESVFSFHPWSLFINLSFMLLKVLALDLPNNISRPMYLSCLVVAWVPIRSWISFMVASEVFLLKILVFSQFIFLP